MNGLDWQKFLLPVGIGLFLGLAFGFFLDNWLLGLLLGLAVGSYLGFVSVRRG